MISSNAVSYTGMFYIPDGGYPTADDSVAINSMYATRSGLIVFTKYKKGDPVVRNAFPRAE